jgi:SAM-dependent methyltransferase
VRAVADEVIDGVSSAEGAGETPMQNAARNAALGMPFAAEERLKPVKRVTARLLRWFVQRQVEFNHAAVATMQAQQQAAADVARGIGELTERVEALRVAIEAVRADQRQELARWRSEHSIVQTVLTRARAEVPAPAIVEELAARADDHDQFYADFENLCRGSEELIRSRLSVYLPEMSEVASLGRILDVGTGRGEFLELLADAGLAGFGVDTNDVTAAQCRARGRDVVTDDALHFMRTLPDASLGAVTAFQVAEHLPFDLLLDLVGEALRVLAPGGLLLLETPNPSNLVVGASNFYIDPTHVRPLPPPLLHAVLWSRGFDPVEVRYVNAPEAAFALPSDLGPTGDYLRPIVERLNELLSGAPDYAVFGRRPRA